MTQSGQPSIWILEINNVDAWSDEARLFTSREAAIECFSENSRYQNVDDLDIAEATRELRKTGEFLFVGPAEDDDFEDEDFMEDDADSNAFKVTVREAKFTGSKELIVSPSTDPASA